MSPRGKGRLGAILLAVSVLTALFAYDTPAVLAGCAVGFLGGVALILGGVRAAFRQMEASQARVASLMEVELERARREKTADGEQGGGENR